eukprot:TRINITY_DN3077_c0_g1_i11.p1 TRINITY_DN3077_c0_g1~~TRINITY_DN3077_c0_g1_i11.p1  ORF type:complete len:330 (-),score=128.38 TRINITY_DN3077_c0_g1_i11:348-1337(-)
MEMFTLFVENKERKDDEVIGVSTSELHSISFEDFLYLFHLYFQEDIYDGENIVLLKETSDVLQSKQEAKQRREDSMDSVGSSSSSSMGLSTKKQRQMSDSSEASNGSNGSNGSHGSEGNNNNNNNNNVSEVEIVANEDIHVGFDVHEQQQHQQQREATEEEEEESFVKRTRSTATAQRMSMNSVSSISSYGSSLSNSSSMSERKISMRKAALLGANLGAHPNASKIGMLTKQGAIVKSWKKRWFVLDGNQLIYYKDESDFQLARVPKGFVWLHGATIEDASEEFGKTHCMKLMTAESDKPFVFRASNDVEMKSWMEALGDEIASDAEQP